MGGERLSEIVACCGLGAAMGNLCQTSKAVEEKKPDGSGARESDKTPKQKRFPYNWPVGAEQVGYLTERQVKARLKTQTEQARPPRPAIHI